MHHGRRSPVVASHREPLWRIYWVQASGIEIVNIFFLFCARNARTKTPSTPLRSARFLQYNGTMLPNKRLFVSVDHAFPSSTLASVMSESELLTFTVASLQPSKSVLDLFIRPARLFYPWRSSWFSLAAARHSGSLADL